MSQFYEDKDGPLYDSVENDKPCLEGNKIPPIKAITLEEYSKYRNSIDENNRKNISHRFSIKLLWCVLLALCGIAVAEYFVEVENEYIKELFEFFKYVATTLIGYLYASNKKDS